MKNSAFLVSLTAGFAAGHLSHGPNDIHTWSATPTVNNELTTQGPNIFATNRVVRVAWNDSFTMSQSTQIHSGVRYVDDPLNKWRLYNFQENAAVPTGSCDGVAANDKHRKHDKNNRDFRHPHHDKRALGDDEHTRDTTSASVSSAPISRPTSETDFIAQHDNITSLMRHVAEKDSKDDKHKHKHHKKHGSDPQCHIDRCMWDNFFKGRDYRPDFSAAGDCHNLETCNDWCRGYVYADHSHWEDAVTLVVMVILGLILLALLALGMLALHKRRKNRKNQDRPAQGQGVAPQATGATPIVVTEASEVHHDDPAGGASNAGGAGGAGGEKAGGEKVVQSGGGDDGKGTMGKRAEEGRGQVQFEDGGHPGSETHVETKPAEAKPAGQMDGAGSAWEVPGLGSVRGRRLQRMGLGGMT